MDDFVYEEEEYRGFTIKVAQEPESCIFDPRTSYDNVFTIKSKMRRSFFGDVESFEYIPDPDDGDVFIEDHWMIEPIYGYSHGGLTISLTPFRDPWDSGIAGHAFVSVQRFIEQTGFYKSVEEAIRMDWKKRALLTLDHEIHLINCFLHGEVAYKTIFDNFTGEMVDECSGYFPDQTKNSNSWEYVLSESRDHIDFECETRNKRRFGKLKAFIKHQVPFEKRILPPMYAIS